MNEVLVTGSDLEVLSAIHLFLKRTIRIRLFGTVLGPSGFMHEHDPVTCITFEFL